MTAIDEVDFGDLVVVSRSCPPDVGGYQRQFAMLLPELATRGSVTAVGAVRERHPGGPGWPGVPTIALPAHRVPRRVRGAVDLVVVAVALCVGIVRRLRRRSDCTLLVLSPTMPGVARLCAWWSRALGGVIVRFPSAGDASRSAIRADLPRSVFVAPGPEQVAEIERSNRPARHIPNAVALADQSGGAPIVAVVGRLVRGKRVDRILDAWAKVSGNHRDWQLVIIGSQGEASEGCDKELRSTAAALEGDSVRFTGELSDPWSVVGDASVLVMASESEGSPNAVLEALARGLVVVAPRTSIALWFDPVPPCVTFESDDELAAVLDQVMSDEDVRSTYMSDGREFAQRAHGVEVTLDTWTATIDDVSSRRVRAGWARVPIDLPPEALVLDVGSGRFPNRRADVLCERYPVRGDRAAVVDRPFVIADAEHLPFRDGAFALAIASHLLEHVDEPTNLIDELGRVSSAAYVETPSRRFERLSPESNHLWATWIRRGELHLEPNRWAASAGSPLRNAFQWLYYAGEEKETATLRLGGRAGRIIRLPARLLRGILNRVGATTTRYRFDGASPPPRVHR